MITQLTEGAWSDGEVADDDALPDGVHTVELVTGDSAGVLRGKRIPASMWTRAVSHGVALANVVFEWSPTCEIRDDAPYSPVPAGVPDLHIVPIVETLRVVPWRSGTARVMCEAVEHDGGPVRVDPRHALKLVLAGAAEMGYDVKAAVEIEFYLLDPATKRPREETLQCYSIERGSLYEHVLAPMRNMITDFGIPIEACNTEYAPGQFEVNVRYDDALTAGDMAVQFRNAVKEIATQHGLLATFMAKPYDDLGGSGVHIHQSLWRGGENAFSDGGQLSETGRHYLGGLQRHMPDMTLLGSPTPTAYKRRQDYSFCPTTASWGGDNRTVGLRVIEGEPGAVRIEQRDASADCNPYLALAAQIAAGLDGIRNRLEPGPRCDADGYTTGLAPKLATSVPEAIARIEASELARATFDPLLLETYIGFCRYEHDAICNRISDLERERYLEAY